MNSKFDQCKKNDILSSKELDILITSATVLRQKFYIFKILSLPNLKWIFFYFAVVASLFKISLFWRCWLYLIQFFYVF